MGIGYTYVKQDQKEKKKKKLLKLLSSASQLTTRTDCHQSLKY
jgi:hypothetical protein